MNIITADFIGLVPTLLKYFVPGYAATYLYYVVTSDKKPGSNSIVVSCVISYIFTLITEALAKTHTCLTDPLSSSIFTIALASITFLIAGLIVNSNWFHDTALSFLHRTFKETAIDDAADLKNGTVVLAYPKQSDFYYVGYFRMYDGKYIHLASHMEYSLSDRSTEIRSFKDDNNESLILKVDDLDRIEMFK